MTDLEMTKLCAEAMGLKKSLYSGKDYLCYTGGGVVPDLVYQPLHNDEQAMALVKKFVLQMDLTSDGYRVRCGWGEVIHPDLNRAVVGCVALFQRNLNAQKN